MEWFTFFDKDSLAMLEPLAADREAADRAGRDAADSPVLFSFLVGFTVFDTARFLDDLSCIVW